MEDNKKIDEKELKNISGGHGSSIPVIECPKCGSMDISAEHRKSGCDMESWAHCNKCGHEWKIDG